MKSPFIDAERRFNVFERRFNVDERTFNVDERRFYLIVNTSLTRNRTFLMAIQRQLFPSFLRNQDGSLLLLTIHQNSHRVLKAYMTDILRLLYSRHCIQDFLIYKAAFTCICIYRKVSHAKRGEVLEEVSTLTRIDIVILQSHLYDNPGSADMRPFYRYTQIMVAGAPTARTYQHIVLAVSKELAVDSFYIIGYIKLFIAEKWSSYFT